jgi:O-antigen/teichoic acid export membrane protein
MSHRVDDEKQAHFDSAGVAAIVDQGALALCRFLLIVGFARLLPADDFGVVTLVISAAYFLAYVQRALIALPFVTSCATIAGLRSSGSDWFWFSTALAILTAALCAVITAILLASNAPEWAVRFVGVFAIAGPACWFYEFSRRWLFQWRSSGIAIAQASGFSVSAAVTFAFFALSPSLARASVVLTVPYVVPAIAAFFCRRPLWPEWPSISQTWLRAWGITKWTLGDAALRLVDVAGIQLWLAIAVGPASAGVFMAGRNVVAPVFTLLSAVELAELPKMSRAFAEQNTSGLRKSLWLIAASIAVFVLPYLGVVFAFSSEILPWMYGSAFAAFGSVLRWWAIVQLLAAGSMPFDWLLLSSLSPRTLFACRAVGIAVMIGAGAFLIEPRGVVGALMAMAAGAFTALALAAFAVLRKGLGTRQSRMQTLQFRAGKLN